MPQAQRLLKSNTSTSVDVFGISTTNHDGRLAWVHGGLWWLRHYAGAFLAEKAMEVAPATGPTALINWIQNTKRGLSPKNDFALTAALHGAIFHTLATLSHQKPITSYPAELAQKWCPDKYTTVHFNYECRHGVGHGIYYVVALSHSELANYSASNQLRPYSYQISKPDVVAIQHICHEAGRIPTAAPTSFSKGCFSGTGHSMLLFDTKYTAYGISAFE